ncbi:Retrovirus-related Pol polyprotein from transposon RE1 [Vitis vinifera]|uniref:Retrovirus-related Pol polyprotein from transposon RE1 n=1 Tax=Vitis vinifera TaxID=29760 RepID=A0A438KAA5_VITVI|nr:Retrovirus-related Pol polyprotein from transposon RE1 [Vitis vinifera]
MKEKMQEKMKMINKNETWKLVERPKNHKVIRVKWVFKTKLNPDGSICKHKARLVVKGYAQQDGVDYQETFAPVARATKWGCGSRQRGLCVLSKEDDMLVTGNQPGLIQSFKDEMNKVFETTDLGVMKYFLGMEVMQSYCKPVSTPMTTREKLSKDDDSEKIDEGLYRSLIGSLLYLTASRPDILFIVSVLSRFMHLPSEKHFLAAKRVLRYINGTVALGVQFSKSAEGGLKLLGYSDSDRGDIFIKALPMERFEALKQKIGVCHPDAKEECLVVGILDSKP